jgi:Kef-type K+ transport system membrane component KefB/nucleotide-binding universal stress UspA family protein
MNKYFTFYFLTLLVFGTLIWLVLTKGENLKSPVAEPTRESLVVSDTQQPVIEQISHEEQHSLSHDTLEYFKNKLVHPISILFLQIIIIIIFSRLFGYLAGKIGQPTVIGEIVAGIVLGPSLVGLLFPEFFSFLFPADSMKNLEILSQIGLVLFMFIIGMELDLKILRLRIKSALVISHTSIIFAFFMGVCLAYLLFESFGPANSTFFGFALFIGIAMSIAAFPVLARIIQERGLTKTHFGKLIITIAAIDDLTAWCILATIIAIIQAGSPVNAIFTILSTLVYIILMIFLIQPLMKKIGSIYISKEILNKKIIAFVFSILFLSALFTEVIGIKALFGGFLAGVIMPQNQNFKKIMTEKIEDLSLVVLLPLFFVLTGLRTHFGLVSEGDMWAICGLIILFAIVGKFGGSFIASLVTKQGLKNSLVIGTLMNTRGLMELIVLNIGYDIGILSPLVFTMLVIMTLVTTFMTGPTLNLIEYISKKKEAIVTHADKRILDVLISFGNPKMGSSLLKLVYSLSGKDRTYHRISALHLTPHTEVTHSDAMKYETNSFAPIKAAANEYDIKLKTIYKTTEDVTKEIIKTARKEKCNLLLIGAAKSVFNKDILGGKVKNIIEQAKCNVGVFIDKDFQQAGNILILTDNIFYERFINISDRFLINSNCKIDFVLSEGMTDHSIHDSFLKNERIHFYEKLEANNASLKKYDLLITNIRYFERLLRDNLMLLEITPSLLLLNFNDNTFSI